MCAVAWCDGCVDVGIGVDGRLGVGYVAGCLVAGGIL